MERDKCSTNGTKWLNVLQSKKSILVPENCLPHSIETMIRCTDECFGVMFITHSPMLFVKRDIDYYVLSSLMKGFRNILTILETKPKFQIIRNHPNFLPVINSYSCVSSVILAFEAIR